QDFPRVPLAAQHWLAFAIEHGLAVGAGLRHAGLAEILLCKDVGRHRRPARGHRDALLAKDRRPIRILDLRCAEIELDPGVWAMAFLGVAAGESHNSPPTSGAHGRGWASPRCYRPIGTKAQ